MRISDWSSDVCSSDLVRHVGGAVVAEGQRLAGHLAVYGVEEIDFVVAGPGVGGGAGRRLVVGLGHSLAAVGQGFARDLVAGGVFTLDPVVDGIGVATASVREGGVVGLRDGAVGRGEGFAGDVVVVGLVVAFPDDVVVAGPGRALGTIDRRLVVGRGVAAVLVGGGRVADQEVVALPAVDEVAAGLGPEVSIGAARPACLVAGPGRAVPTSGLNP